MKPQDNNFGWNLQRNLLMPSSKFLSGSIFMMAKNRPFDITGQFLHFNPLYTAFSEEESNLPDIIRGVLRRKILFGNPKA